jgi:hypothetical protein
MAVTVRFQAGSIRLTRVSGRAFSESILAYASPVSGKPAVPPRPGAVGVDRAAPAEPSRPDEDCRGAAAIHGAGMTDPCRGRVRDGYSTTLVERHRRVSRAAPGSRTTRPHIVDDDSRSRPFTEVRQVSYSRPSHVRLVSACNCTARPCNARITTDRGRASEGELQSG